MILDGKRILVTGGTGSMGKVLIRRILSGEVGTPKKVVVLSRDEAKQHDMRLEFTHRRITTDEVIYRNFLNVLEFRIGDVRSYSDVCSSLKDIDVVANAAALKQVPTCEYFPDQAIRTNCNGPVNLVRAIHEQGYPVETVIGISTDKAAKPVNVMGMTKALQERILISANILAPKTRFICVRYGNVLASRGSVVPLFIEQIKAGGPVTITTPEMTRFLLTIDQAVDTVFTALREARPGETYIPNIPSATILNVAKAMIGSRKVELKIIGIRPGEKIHEILVSEEECHHCVKRGDGYYAILPMLPDLRERLTSSEPNALTREFSSADNVIDQPRTADLLKRHGLMPEQVQEGIEILK